ncbi:16S rRNA pseudouridine(516) synthase, partial [Neisseria sp. P0017.S007]
PTLQLHKYIQTQPHGSRQQCPGLIDNDCIAINGEIHKRAKDDIDPSQDHTLSVDGEEIDAEPMPYYYIYLHKPADYET